MVCGVQKLFDQGPFAEYEHIDDYIGDIKAKPNQKPGPDNGVLYRGSTILFFHLVNRSLLCKP